MSIFLKKVIFKSFLRKRLDFFILQKRLHVFFVKPGKFPIEILEEENYLFECMHLSIALKSLRSQN